MKSFNERRRPRRNISNQISKSVTSDKKEENKNISENTNKSFTEK